MTKLPHDYTDEYLEFLAGRRAEPPTIPPEHEDVPEVLSLLRTLRHQAPNPTFTNSLRTRIIKRAHMNPRTPASQSAEPRSSMAIHWARQFAIPAGAFAAAVIIVVFLPLAWKSFGPKTYTPQSVQAATITLTAAGDSQSGVAANTTFTIKGTDGTLTAADVEKNLRFSPEVKFAVASAGENAYTVKPQAPLEKNSVYAASYASVTKNSDGTTTPHTYSWAYQVQNDFQVTGTLPRTNQTSIDRATGIEFTFSTGGVSQKDFADHFSITPSVPGHFESHYRTISFVPKTALAPLTFYTVKLRKGVSDPSGKSAIAEDTIVKFVTASGDTTTGSQSIQPMQYFESYRPNETVVFSTSQYYGTNSPKASPGSKMPITVYAYPNATAFADALQQYIGQYPSWAMSSVNVPKLPSADLRKVNTYSVQSQDGLVPLGTGFPAGFYLAQTDFGDVRSQVPFVVSDVSAYVMTTQTDTAVWVNDLATKKPLAAAAIKISGQTTTTNTDTTGLARLTTPTNLIADRNADFAVVTSGQRQAIVALNNDWSTPYVHWRYGQTSPDHYWSYVSTDRLMYGPTDTVHVWGFLRSRTNGETPKTVALNIIHHDWSGPQDVISTVATSPVTVRPDGTYSAALHLDHVTVGYSNELILVVDGQQIETKSLDIRTFTLPTYQLSLTPDRFAAVDGDTVRYTAKVTFYDGTPVPNFSLLATNGQTSVPATTNASGVATFTDTASYSMTNYQVSPTLDASLSGNTTSTYVQMYRAALLLSSTNSQKDSTGTITGTVRNIDVSKATPQVSDIAAAIDAGPRPNAVVTGHVVAMVNVKVDDGTKYDFLTKKNVPLYHYESRDQARGDITATTNAAGKFTMTVPMDKNTNYRVELSVPDDRGRTDTTTEYFYPVQTGNMSNGTWYSLTDPKPSDTYMSAPYSVGEPVTLNLRDQDGNVPATTAKFLFLTAQVGLQTVKIQSSPDFTFTFSEADVPNIATMGAVFDGRHYFPVWGPTLDFRQQDRKLTFAITTDKKQYAPGETATIHVAVTGPDKKPQITHLNIKAVDEAIESLTGEDTQDPLTGLYRTVSSGILGTFVTHREIAQPTTAEGGGGGGDERTHFPVLGLFTDVDTNGQGQATVSFKVPDNLTSWRITAQGVTDGLMAGTENMLVAVKKDLFVTPTLQERMLTSDTQTMFVAAYGTSLKAADRASFSVTVDDAKTPLTVSGPAFTQVPVPLPALSTGDHTIHIRVDAKGKTDAIAKHILVINSNVVQHRVETANLTKNEKPIFSTTGRTVVQIADADRNLAYQQLWSLTDTSYGRLDQTVASAIAGDLLEHDFAQTPAARAYDPNAFLTETGLALYPYGSNDLEYGSLAAGDSRMAPVQGTLNAWFQSVLNNPKTNSEQAAEALLGLAALKEPVLSDIRLMLAIPNLPDRERLTLTLALEALGAKEEARPIASQLLTKYGNAQPPYISLTLGQNDDEKIVSTARFAILAASLELPERWALLQYLAVHQPKDTTISLELALAYQRLLAGAPNGQATITYALNGETVTKKLSGTEPLVLNLTTEEAKTFSVVSTTGNVSAVSTFDAPFDPTTLKTDPNLSISRQYTVKGKSTLKFTRGDIVKITLTWNAKKGAAGTQFVISDFLPSGLKILTDPWALRAADASLRDAYPSLIEYNRVQFDGYLKSFSYYAQAATVGSSLAEPPVVQALDVPGNIQFGSQSQSITISDRP